MAIKSKNIRYSGWFKLAAGVLGCIGAVLCFWGLLDWDAFPAGVQSARYVDSAQSSQDFQMALSGTLQVAAYYQNEDHIKNGDTLSSSRINAEKDIIQRQKEDEIKAALTQYSDEWNGDGGEKPAALTQQINELIASIAAKYNNQIDGVRGSLIQQQLQEYRRILSNLNDSGFLWSVYRDGVLLSGCSLSPADYESMPAYVRWDAKKGLTAIGKAAKNTNLDWRQEEFNFDVFLFGIPPTVFSQNGATYSVLHARGFAGIWRFISGFVLMVFSWGWLVYTAGRKPGDSDIHLNFADRLYLDITAAVAAGIDIMAIYTFGVLLTATDFLHPSLFVAAGIGLLLAAWGATAFFLVTLSKRLKRREVLRHTLIFFIISLILKPFILIRNAFSARPFEKQFSVALFLFTGCLAGSAILSLLFASGIGPFGGLVLFLILTVITLAAGLGYIRQNLGAVALLADGVGAIRGGRLDYAFSPTGSVFVDSIASDVGNLSEGLSKAVASEVAAQKMKVELITNVSHDLKTPLTSIISYTDLLSKEKEMSQDGKKYLGIVAEKSLRLKKLIDDLFEISKAESGQISAQVERLSLEELLRQAVAEFGQRLEAYDLSVKLPEWEDDLFILGDSARLWRVFSNIFGNLEKYALPHTRVYIDTEADANTIKVTFKNISNYEMNFDPSRISERFQRGEEARTGEGSGLGLAIVGSFMELQGGRCDIAVDGDLFKLTLVFQRTQ